VCLLAADYPTVQRTLAPLLEKLGEEDQAAILGGTARAWYRPERSAVDRQTPTSKKPALPQGEAPADHYPGKSAGGAEPCGQPVSVENSPAAEKTRADPGEA
jgi:hypothetical protein